MKQYEIIRSVYKTICGFVIAATFTGYGFASFVVFEAVGSDPAAITPARDAFRAAIGGGNVSGPHGNFGGVRREINWDAVGAAFSDPNPLPGDFFNSNSPRGAVFSTPGTGFLVSSTSGSPLFGLQKDFQTFSPAQLFTALHSNETDVTFFRPGTSTPTTTNSFGVVFVDVETANGTTLEFFDSSNVLLFSRSALVAGNRGLSFVGAIADAGEQISRVRITSGVNTIVSNRVHDIVVVDDFIYGTPVPEPGTLVLPGIGLAVLAAVRRLRRQS